MDFLDFLEFFLTDFLGFLDFLKIFQIFWDCWIFFGFILFFWFLSKLLRLLLNVTTVTTGHQKSPKMGQNSIKSSFFARKAKRASAEGRSPPQQLEVGPRSVAQRAVSSSSDKWVKVKIRSLTPPTAVLHVNTRRLVKKLALQHEEKNPKPFRARFKNTMRNSIFNILVC